MNIHDYANGVLLIHKFQEEVYNRIVEFHINNKPMTFMKTKPFTVEGCKANGNRAVTRDGRTARIFDYDSEGVFPITGRVLGEASSTTWKENGSVLSMGEKHPFDLFLPCEAMIRPWTPEEAIGKVVQSRDRASLWLITESGMCGVRIGQNMVVSGDVLLSDYTQPDGSPCGVEVEE